ncbi:hypothetical protein NL676_029963 [Syzygium grande]|nr:hypothetical protein NL676_029963 [Syzygium grande]
MEPVKLSSGPLEAVITNIVPLIQEGMQPHSHGCSHGRSVSSLARRDSSHVRVIQGPIDGVDSDVSKDDLASNIGSDSEESPAPVAPNMCLRASLN